MAISDTRTLPPAAQEDRRRLIRQAKHQVFLIVDRHPVHRAARVRDFLAGHADRVELMFLPPYSPELNPDEFLNQDVKANAVAATRPRDLAVSWRAIVKYR